MNDPMNPQFSIVAPVYGVEPYLDACVTSILRQTFNDFELVLVDDGSPDNCPEMCDRWAEKDPCIKVIHQRNAGLSGARNTGLAAARGEFVLFVDSDDAVEVSLLERCAGVISANPAVDVVYFGYVVPGRKERYTLPSSLIGHEKTGDDVLWHVARGTIPSHAWQFIARRSLYHGIEFPVGRVAEDLAVTYRVLERANLVYSLPDCLYRYQVREDSIIGRSTEKQLSYYTDELTSFNEMREAFQGRSELLSAVNANMLDHLFDHYVHANDHDVSQAVAELISGELQELSGSDVLRKHRWKAFLFRTGILKYYSYARNIAKSIVKGK